MHVAAVAFVVVTQLSASSPSTDSQRPALDHGETLRRVDTLRAKGEYDRAAAELRGFLERWRDGGLLLRGLEQQSFDSELERVQELMKKMVELEELMQDAYDDEDSARRYLANLISPTEPTSRTAEQAMGLKLLARHDRDVAALIDHAFPARVVIEADAPGDPNLLAFPLESALIEVSRNAFPILPNVGASELRVHITMYENDTRGSAILAGTSMKSFAMSMSAILVGADGDIVVKAATTTAALGINPGNAAKYGASRCAQVLYAQLVDELAKRVALGY